ncbi:MAG: dTDP-glucose 4,6-dehydratase [Rickettsiella sp.]|nr:dTDP-glucose 4,6-dehydratase [Rickettsiella sp.]
MRFLPKNMLVTGGAGFIGSHFVHYYQKNYPEVFIVNLDKLTYAGGLKKLVGLLYSNKHTFIQGDIRDKQLIYQLLREFCINTVVHFAAETHVDRSIEDPDSFVQTNVLGTLSLLEESRKYCSEKNWTNKDFRFHHVSTDEVYGTLKKNEQPFTEMTAYAPTSPYSSSKAASDHLVNAYYRTYGLATTMSHCSNNYGLFQHDEKFIPTIIRHCLAQQSIPVYGDGSNIRDWLHVEDHCSGIDSIIRAGKIGETYNIGGNTELSNLEVIACICSTLNQVSSDRYEYDKLVSFKKDRLGHDWRYAIDTGKISRELNWKPRESFVSGIRKTLEAYLTKIV